MKTRGKLLSTKPRMAGTASNAGWLIETIWLSQSRMAELFQRSKQTISEHLRNIFDEGELNENSVVRNFRTTAADGKTYNVTHYNLEAILAVGFRVKSPRGTQFRRWANTQLREFIVKGFVMDDERLKNPGGFDYFDELLARIREIRASEKRFYQKVRDLFVIWCLEFVILDKHSTAAPSISGLAPE